MKESLALNLTIQETNDYFRVITAIKTVEESKYPDLEKIKVLFHESKRLFSNLNLHEINKVHCLKWNGTNYITAQLPEEKVINEIEEGINRATPYHQDVAIQNISNIARHYKVLFYYSKIYVPFFNSCMELIERIVRNPRISEIYEDQVNSKDLIKEIALIEHEKSELKDQIKKMELDMQYLKNELTEKLFDADSLKLINKLTRENVKDENLLRILMVLQFNKDIDVTKLFKKTKIPPQDIIMLITKHKDYFIFDTKTEKIMLNYEKLVDQEKTETEIKKIKKIDSSGVRTAYDRLTSSVTSIMPKKKPADLTLPKTIRKTKKEEDDDESLKLLNMELNEEFENLKNV